MTPAMAHRRGIAALYRPVPSLCASSWLLLAAWLAFWPAIASHRASSRDPVPVRHQTASAAGHSCCCAAQPPAAPADREAPHGCCNGPLGSPVRAPSCPDGSASRCAQCVGFGTAPLLADATPVSDPERSVLGSFLDGDRVADSRDLRPPVPPPRAAGESLFA